MRTTLLTLLLLTLMAGPARAGSGQEAGALLGWAPDYSYVVLRWNNEWQSTNYQKELKDDDEYKLCPTGPGSAPGWPRSVGRPRAEERCATVSPKAYRALKLQLAPGSPQPPAGVKAELGERGVAVLTGKWRLVQATDGSPDAAHWRPDGKGVAFAITSCTGTGDWCWPEVGFLDFAWSLAGQPPPPGSQCLGQTRASFHLRAAEALESSGPELPRGTPVEVLAAASLTRGKARLYKVRAKPKKGPAQTGYAFLTPDELSAGACPE